MEQQREKPRTVVTTISSSCHVGCVPSSSLLLARWMKSYWGDLSPQTHFKKLRGKSKIQKNWTRMTWHYYLISQSAAKERTHKSKLSRVSILPAGDDKKATNPKFFDGRGACCYWCPFFPSLLAVVIERNRVTMSVWVFCFSSMWLRNEMTLLY